MVFEKQKELISMLSNWKQNIGFVKGVLAKTVGKETAEAIAILDELSNQIEIHITDQIGIVSLDG